MNTNISTKRSAEAHKTEVARFISQTYANVSGTATLAGTVNAAFASGSYAGKQYTILQSSGISGTFSAVRSGFRLSRPYPEFARYAAHSAREI